MGYFFDRFFGSFLTYFGSHFGPFWEPKSFKHEVQKSHVKRDDFHVSPWAPWGGSISSAGGLQEISIPPARAFPIDNSLLSIGF